MRKRIMTKKTLEIYHMLDFFLRCTPLGLLPFMEEGHPLLTSEEIIDCLYDTGGADAFETRVTGGLFVPEAQRVAERTEPYTAIIKEYGGIEHIRAVVQRWVARYPQKGGMIRLWSCKGGKGIYTMTDVATQSGYTDAAVPYKVCKTYLMAIAYDIYVSRYVLV